jgi:hypothetical protein
MTIDKPPSAEGGRIGADDRESEQRLASHESRPGPVSEL